MSPAFRGLDERCLALIENGVVTVVAGYGSRKRERQIRVILCLIVYIAKTKVRPRPYHVAAGNMWSLLFAIAAAASLILCC